jgi:hypothetical protein
MEGDHYAEDDFYMWVGKCIKEWAAAESYLFEICSLILKASSRQVAIIYYRTHTLGAQLTLLDDLMKTVLPKGKSKSAGEWAALVKEIRDLLPIRNLLAHAPVGHAYVTEWIENEGKIEPVDSRWLHVTTSFGEQLTGKFRSIDQPELPGHFDRVRAVKLRLGDFVARLKARERQARRATPLRRRSRRSSG